jgi:mycofactocin glycosyltransferase
MTRYPADLPLQLDRSTKVLADGAALVGGQPARLLRLTRTGAQVLQRLRTTGPGPDPDAQALARLLVDSGVAHPRPPIVERGGVTVVVPVRDRAEQLDACLAAAGTPAIVVDDGSRDPQAIRAVCDKHHARLVRCDIPGGPAVARNTGLALAGTPIVAFIDSDCTIEGQWFERLGGHFADPAVAAVAPRVRAVSSASGPVARFAVARSPIDLGTHPARVVPMGRVSYVPTATLLVRRSAAGNGFDEQLRFGEDVDLVWRLHLDGGTVRFDPSVSVFHHEPTRWRDLLLRHYRYGTGAAQLAKRHPGKLSPLVIEPRSALIAVSAMMGRPRLAASIAVAVVARSGRSGARAQIPRSKLAAWSMTGAWKMTLGLGHALAMFFPAALLGAVRKKGSRRPALFLLFAPPITEWIRRRPALDPIRWALLSLADDAAYGFGVWVGCARERTVGPVMPTVMRREGAVTAIRTLASKVPPRAAPTKKAARTPSRSVPASAVGAFAVLVSAAVARDRVRTRC